MSGTIELMKNTAYHRSGGRSTESFPRGIVCVAQTIQDGNSRKRVKRLVNGIASRHEGVRAINPVHTMHLTFMTVLVAMINAKTCAQNNSATLFDDFESFIDQEVGTEPVRVWVHEKTPLIAVGNSSNKLGLRIHPDPNLLTMRKKLDSFMLRRVDSWTERRFEPHIALGFLGGPVLATLKKEPGRLVHDANVVPESIVMNGIKIYRDAIR